MDDDFFDRTVIQIKPAANAGGSSALSAQRPTGATKYPPINYHRDADVNPILGYCTPMLCYVAELKNMPHVDDVGQLFSLCANDIKQITEGLRNVGMPDNAIVSTRYMLCGFIDEMVLNTPWGARSQWASQSLLSFFHKEVNAGQKFFQILDKVLTNPSHFIDIIEFGYVCLCHGYMGKYRLQPNGASEVNELKARLLATIKQTRPDGSQSLAYVPPLDPALGGSINNKKTTWIVAASCLLLIMVTFVGLLFNLNSRSDPVAIRASAIGLNLPQLIKKERKQAPINVAPNWQALVAADIAADKIDVARAAEGIRFTLNGENLFASGSSELLDSQVVDNLIEALKAMDGPLLVTGHTDNVPIRTVRFPSNWQLSEARAEAVAQRLRQALPGRTIDVEGMADSQPLAPNDSRSNRAKNRRVEINVYVR